MCPFAPLLLPPRHRVAWYTMPKSIMQPVDPRSVWLSWEGSRLARHGIPGRETYDDEGS